MILVQQLLNLTNQPDEWQTRTKNGDTKLSTCGTPRTMDILYDGLPAAVNQTTRHDFPAQVLLLVVD